MNILCTKTLNIKGNLVDFCITNKALYRSQIELNKKGLLDLLENLDKVDLVTIFTILKNSAQTKITIDDLLDSELNIIEITTFLVECFSKSFEKKNNSGDDLLEKK